MSKREKTLLCLTIAVIVLSVVLVPAFDRIRSLDREIVLMRGKVEKYTRLMAQKESLQAHYGALVAQLGESSGQRKDTLVNALCGLENLARTSGVHIVDIRPSPRSSLGTKESAKEVLIELKCTGSIEEYLKFMYEMENSLLLLRIKNYELGVKGNTQNLEAAMTIAATTLLGQ